MKRFSFKSSGEWPSFLLPQMHTEILQESTYSTVVLRQPGPCAAVTQGGGMTLSRRTVLSLQWRIRMLTS